MRLTPKNRKEWRNWLAGNHACKAEIWLVFLKKTTGRPNLSYNDAVEEAVCFGWIDGVKRSIDDERYMHRFTPRRPSSNWSETNKERAQRMIETGQMAPAGKKAIEIAKKKGKWANPISGQSRIAMPAELGKRLRQNKKASDHFDALAPSHQQQYIAWITAAKKPATRTRRLDEAVALLNRGEKLGMR